MEGVVISIIIGVISGLLSGIMVYYFTKSRESKYQTYYYLVNYLCQSMEDIEIEIPLDIPRYASQVGDKESLWGQAIKTIIDERRKYEITNEELPEEYALLSNSILIAYSELNKWAKKNGLDVNKDNSFISCD